MRVKAKLTRVNNNWKGKPDIIFKKDCFYSACEGLDGIFTVSDSHATSVKFTNEDFHRMFEVVKSSKPKHRGIYIIEYGSVYASDPWDIIGYCETEEEAKEFINKQYCSSLYHYTCVDHILNVKEK